MRKVEHKIARQAAPLEKAVEMTRDERRLFERKQLVAFAIGATTIPGAGPDSPRATVLLSDLIVRPQAWVSWLWDAMGRRGKGFRIPSMRRGPQDARRADKRRTTKLSRRIAK